jgi:hypothetical protein
MRDEDQKRMAEVRSVAMERFGRGRVMGIVVLAVGVGLVSVPTLLLANGGTLRLANVPMGSYQVSVFTDPTPVRPDSLDVSVLIFDTGLGGVPDGVEVTVTSELLEVHAHPNGAPAMEPGMGQTLRATREQADDPRYYAAKFALGAEGLWRITVAVQGEGGEGEASFEIRAREGGLLGRPLVLTLLAVLPLLAAWWFLSREDKGREENGEAVEATDGPQSSDGAPERAVEAGN